MSFKNPVTVSLIGTLAVSFIVAGCSDSPTASTPTNDNTSKTKPTYKLVASETEAEFIPGVKTKVWAYNGTVPGPTIHANVGDEVIIEFKNELPEPSSVHWHGLEVPAKMDGSPLSQRAVEPGETFTYRFKVHRAATYWYHSHVNNNEQVEKGLHGALIVHDPKENKDLGLPEREITLLLDDILLDDELQIAPELPSEKAPKAEMLLNGREGNYLLVNGKRQPTIRVTEGVPVRLRLINAANSRFMRLSFPGQTRISRIGGDTGLIPEALQILEIGQVTIDAWPLPVSDPDQSKGIMLTPGERAEIYWVPELGPNGDRSIYMEWHDLKRGRHKVHFAPPGQLDIVPDTEDGRNPKQVMAQFQIEPATPAAAQATDSLALNLRPSVLYDELDVTNPKPLEVTFGHTKPDNEGNVEFFAYVAHGMDMEGGMDGSDDDEEDEDHGGGHGGMDDEMGMGDGHMMMGVPMMMLTNEQALDAKVGDIRIIEVKNMTAGIHPFHMHGFPFQLIDTQYFDAEEEDNNRIVKNDQKSWSEWKDTFAIPPRPGFRMKSWTKMRFLVRLDDEHRPGESLVAHGGEYEAHPGLAGGWLVHCHILEHARYGMGTWLNLRPRNHDSGNGHGHDH